MTRHVLVVGDIVTDVVAVLDGPIAYGSDTDARIDMTGGGAGANTATWLVSAGAQATLCGVVGSDDAGTARLAELAAYGVGCSIRAVPGARTGSIVVLTDRAERSMLTDRGANLLLTPADVDAALGLAVHLHLSGYVLLDAATRPAARHALREAARRGMTTSVDAASAGPLRRVGGADFLSWVRATDVLFANIDEASALLGRDGEPAELCRELAGSVRIAIVKTGPSGAVAASPDGFESVPAEPAIVVDTTGAGDAFAAGFLAAWEGSASVRDALTAGARWGARAVSAVGARPLA